MRNCAGSQWPAVPQRHVTPNVPHQPHMKTSKLMRNEHGKKKCRWQTFARGNPRLLAEKPQVRSSNRRRPEEATSEKLAVAGKYRRLQRLPAPLQVHTIRNLRFEPGDPGILASTSSRPVTAAKAGDALLGTASARFGSVQSRVQV